MRLLLLCSAPTAWREAADRADAITCVRVHIDQAVPRMTFTTKVNVDADGSQRGLRAAQPAGEGTGCLRPVRAPD